MLSMRIDHANMIVEDNTVMSSDMMMLADDINKLMFKYKIKCSRMKDLCYSFIRLNPFYKLIVVVDPEKEEENPYLLLYGSRERMVTRNIPYKYLKVLLDTTTFAALDFVVDNVNSSSYRRLQIDELTKMIVNNIKNDKEEVGEER